MATSITGLSEAQLDDTVVMALSGLLPFLGAFSTKLDFTGEELPAKGDTRTVAVVGKITIGPKTPGVTVDPSGKVAGVPVVMDQFLGGSFQATEGTMSARAFTNWWAKQIPAAVHGLAAKVVNNGIGLAKKSSYASESTVDLATLDARALATVRAAAKKLIHDPRALLLAGPDLSAIITVLEPVVNVFSIVDKANIVANDGLPGRLIGYKAFEYDELPDNGEHLVGAVIHPAALAIAASAPAQLLQSGQGDVVYRRIITEPESGLSVQYTETVQGGGLITGEVACLTGAKVVDKTAAHRIVTAA